MANFTADVRIFNFAMGLCAISAHLNALTKKRSFNLSTQDHILAAIIDQNARHRAVLTENRLPLVFITICEQAALFKISAPVIIPIKETALFAIGCFHFKLNPGDIFPRASIHTDDITFFNEGGNLDFQPRISDDLFCDTCGCVTSCCRFCRNDL